MSFESILDSQSINHTRNVSVSHLAQSSNNAMLLDTNPLFFLFLYCTPTLIVVTPPSPLFLVNLKGSKSQVYWELTGLCP